MGVFSEDRTTISLVPSVLGPSWLKGPYKSWNTGGVEGREIGTKLELLFIANTLHGTN